MNLKSILVALSCGAPARAAIKGAAVMARAHKAHLVGLHVVDITPFAAYTDTYIPVQILEMQQEQLRAAAAEVETAFRQICADAGIDSEWRCIEGSTHRVIDLHARYCDLLCASAPTSTADGFASLPFGEELVFSTGRPVLFIPENFDAKSIDNHVAVAWDGSREASKAINQTMAILSRAQRVSVVSVSDKDLDAAQADIIAADMIRYLAMHGVNAQAQTVEAGTVPVGQFLHDWARGQNADLLVMGAYGHTRFREFIFGGVTHWTLRHGTIPVLMTH